MPRKGWVVGHKRTLIQRYQDVFLKAKKKGVVYRAVARGLLCRAGDDPFNFDLKKNDIVDASEPSQLELDQLMNTDGLDEEEVKRRQGVLKKLATDVGYYYRQEASKRSKKSVFDLNRIARAQLKKKKAKKVQRWHVYSRLYYTERVKDTFEQRYPEEVEKWRKRKEAAEANGEKFTEKRPAVIATRNRITREVLKNEDAQTKAAVEKEYQEELKAQKDLPEGVLDFDEPQTPQEYYEALLSLPLFAQPLVDACATKTGGIAAILICAPMPDDGGELGVLSVHAGRTRGLVNEKWPNADPSGFRIAQQKLIDFARDVFSPEECRRRALPTNDGPKLKDKHNTKDDEDEDDDDDEDLERQVEQDLDEEDDGNDARSRNAGKKSKEPQRWTHNENEHDEQVSASQSHTQGASNESNDTHPRGENERDNIRSRSEDEHDDTRSSGEDARNDTRPRGGNETDNTRSCGSVEPGNTRSRSEQGYNNMLSRSDDLDEMCPHDGDEHDDMRPHDENDLDDSQPRGEHEPDGIRSHDEHDEDRPLAEVEHVAPRQHSKDRDDETILHDKVYDARSRSGHDIEMHDDYTYGTHPSMPMHVRNNSRPLARSGENPLFLAMSSPIQSPAPSPSHSPARSSASSTSQLFPPSPLRPLGSSAHPRSQPPSVSDGMETSPSGARPAPRPAPTRVPQASEAVNNTRVERRAHVTRASASTSAKPRVPDTPAASPSTSEFVSAPRPRPLPGHRSVSTPTASDNVPAPSQKSGCRTSSQPTTRPAGSRKALPATQSSPRVQDTSTDGDDTHEAWTLQPTAAWSDHVRKAVDACRRGQAWGRAFGDAVLSYVTFEQGHGFAVEGAPARKMNPNMTRPDVYRAWTKLGRPYDRLMELGMPVNAFREVWWAWWDALMPSVRRLDNGRLLNSHELAQKIKKAEGWEGFDEFCGKDGLLQVLLSLLWWGDAVHGGGCSRKDLADWDVACADFSGVLDAVAITMGYKRAGRKRRSPAERPGPSKRPRKSAVDGTAVAPATKHPLHKSNGGESSSMGSTGKSSRRRR